MKYKGKEKENNENKLIQLNLYFFKNMAEFYFKWEKLFPRRKKKRTTRTRL